MLERIGSGSFAEVYDFVVPNKYKKFVSLICAAKVIDFDSSEEKNNQEIIKKRRELFQTKKETFIRERNFLKDLQNERIAAYYGFVEYNDSQLEILGILMEKCLPLTKVLDEYDYRLVTAMNWINQLLKVATWLCEKEVLHNDIGLYNLLVASEDVRLLKLCDFDAAEKHNPFMDLQHTLRDFEDVGEVFSNILRNYAQFDPDINELIEREDVPLVLNKILSREPALCSSLTVDTHGLLFSDIIYKTFDTMANVEQLCQILAPNDQVNKKVQNVESEANLQSKMERKNEAKLDNRYKSCKKK